MKSQSQNNKTAPASLNGGIKHKDARLPWKRAHVSVFDSSIMEEPYHVRLVFDYMIRKADASGFCLGTEASLTRLFNVDPQHMAEALQVLESRDRKSRTPANEGQRIEKVHGGWLILNYSIYQSQVNGDNPTSLVSLSETETETEKERESENRVNYPNRVNDPSTKVVRKVNDEANYREIYLSGREREVFDQLTGRAEKVFVILKEWATEARKRGNSKFPVSREKLAKGLECSGPNITAKLQKLVDLGAIEKVDNYDYHEGTSNTYKWLLTDELDDYTTTKRPTEPPQSGSDAGEDDIPF